MTDLLQAAPETGIEVARRLSGHEWHDFAALAPSPPAVERGCSMVMCTYKRAASLARFLDSLEAQRFALDELVIVDASPDRDTETAVFQRPGVELLARSVTYVRVSGNRRGLTRQRNLGLRLIGCDLVAFFDDDVVLLPGCLAEMERTLRGDEGIVGVGAVVPSKLRRPEALWRVRHRLRTVPNLEPGRYHRSGLPTPWGFVTPDERLVDGDWLPGAAMWWRTAIARRVGFKESFAGYAKNEDLDFSLRATAHGRLVMATAARVDHLRDPSGRPDFYELGYATIYNSIQVHRDALPDRTWKDAVWFAYAWAVELVLLARHLRRPSRWPLVVGQVRGRCRATYDLIRGREGVRRSRRP